MSTERARRNARSVLPKLTITLPRGSGRSLHLWGTCECSEERTHRSAQTHKESA